MYLSQQNILGVRIDIITQSNALKQISAFLNSNSQNTIFTPNPEMLVSATTRPSFHRILNSSSLNICDGIGIKIVARLYGKMLERIPGVDFMVAICRLAVKARARIYLLGSADKHVLEKTKQKLTRRFPQLKIVGMHPGLSIQTRNKEQETTNRVTPQNSSIKYDLDENRKILLNIRSHKPDILFVAFGQIKQECWLAENLLCLPSVKVAMGVGGAFDFISGKVKRAPRWVRQSGLEWLWRLFCQPWRASRIWNATVRFLWLSVMRRGKKN